MALAQVVKDKAPSLIVAWLVGVTLLAGLAGLANPARAANCSAPVGGPGDWTVADVEVCDGIVIVMDGNLTVTGAGDLTIRNGGIKFVEDTTHVYTVTVTGALRLVNSRVWTETNLINPYLRLSVTIDGTLTASASTLAFPGTIHSNSGSSVTFSQGSLITRTATAVSSVFSTTAAQDDNDDAPGLSFDGSTVFFYASRVDSLYENNEGGFAGDPRQTISLTGTTTFTAADTFLGIDFNGAISLHNVLSLTGTANAYLYGVSIDTNQSPTTQDLYVPAITTAAGTRADLYRWADIRVVDANGVPVNLATITANFAGSLTGPATFRDSGTTNPPLNILAYLGKTAVSWHQSGVDGTAHMPLLSDYIDSTTMPDSRFAGVFRIDATSGANTGTGSLTFPAYPAMRAEDTASSLTITIATLTQPLPDLTPVPPTFAPAVAKEGQTVLITAPIANQGAGGAANVLVRIYDGNTLLRQTTIGFIGAGGQQSVSATLPNATGGQHVIRVWADPDNAVYEGPSGSPPETNNLKGYPLSVTPLGPDLAVDVSFNPDPGFLNNPVQLQAGVTNVGDRNATNVLVNFYIQIDQPTSSSTPVGSAVIPAVDISATGTFDWTPTSLGDFTVWAWVDPNDAIPEPAPYSKANDLNSNVLRVTASPDLVTLPQDLTMTDPYPVVGQPVTLEAVVRNRGQAPTGGFQVDFLVDGTIVGSRTNAFGLSPGEPWPTNLPTAAFTTCGSHTIGIHVDSTNLVPEGSLYEQNNDVTSTVQVFPNQVLSWASGTITADQAFSSSLEITGPVSISNARINIVQDQAPCGRYYVKVLGGGSLTLTNAQLASNWPLVVFVAGVPSTGSLTAVNTTFALDTAQGKGALHSKGTLSLTRSTVMGDVIARGTSAVFRGDTFSGSLLHVDTTSTTRLWDSAFPGVTTLELASDATPKSAPDFDLRNATFNAALTAQLVFTGTQWASLTSVTLTRPGDWWAGMLTQDAHVTLYWWLTIQTVDGTGTRIEDQNTTVDLKRFNPTTLVWDPAPQCALAPDECYFNTGGTWQVGVKKGVLLYRAAAEERYGSLPPAVRATYRTDGYTFIENQVRLPDQIVSSLVTQDRTLTLTFSALTPDLTVVAIHFNGQNGVDVASQPIMRPLTLQATVRNLGQIITRNVSVYFYSTDVDLDRNGLVDNPHAFYVSAGFFIGASGPLNVNARGWANFTAPWTPQGSSETSLAISAVVDPLSAIRELNERNNTQTGSLNIFAWPDLHFATNPVTKITPLVQIVNNDVTLEIAVTNEGTNTATNAVFGVYDTSNNLLSATVTLTVLRSETATFTLVWRPTTAGAQTVRIRAIAAGGVFPGEFRNFDFDLTDNSADRLFTINAQPELTVSANGTAPSPFRGAPFVLNVIVHNSGGTPVAGVVISVCDRAQSALCDQAASGVWLGAWYDATIPTSDKDFAIQTRYGVSGIGNQNLTVMVDANNTINEQNENNNQAIIPIVIKPPTGSIFLDQPLPGRVFQPGDTISVSGHVIQTDGTPIPGVTLTITLLDPAGNAVAPTPITQDSGDPDGGFFAPVTVPSGPAGTYRILVATSSASVSPAAADITVNVPVSFFNTVFLGLPLWIWLIIIVGAAAAIGGGTAYVKFVGLGKLVECGECGSFIPEDSTKCPKCGVEFEKDMAKCSNCQAWIPVDVKQCPECGVEFATGEVEMADYEAQMRRQYEDVRRKFREEASRELGRTLSDREFDDWWRTQPTFVTFEDWLREEEDMRRMGSKPCPVCSTLNSVTATVCHKCGTLLKEETRRPAGGGRPPAAAPARVVTPAAQAPSEGTEAGMPSEAIPKKVIKKPLVGTPVVQKKVIKRPLEEQKEGEGGGSGGDEGEQI